ncbi:hypothetical protein [Motilibacter peucedani]|uniref:hypothetical protein n=1 Tax=Motilibacter peucedani TaxID=598650 RepID=UPI0016036D63|nr:hypothetical protein [Motilibacter peucedani]
MDSELVTLEHRIAVLADAWDTDRSDAALHDRLVAALRLRRDLLQPTLLELPSARRGI